MRSRSTFQSSGRNGLWATEIEIGRPDRAAIRRMRLELAVEVDEVADDLEHARPDRTERLGDADQLVGLGGERRRELAAAAAVVERPRRREAQGAGGDGFAREVGHRRDVVRRGRRLSLGAPLAHHVQAQRAVRDLRPEVEVAGPRGERVEVLGERLPVPAQALVQGRAGDVLDALHQLDQPLVIGRAHRGEPDAAVAHHDRRHPVPARRGELVVPRGLAVVVGVDVDEAGRHEGAVGVDLPAPRARRSGRRR